MLHAYCLRHFPLTLALSLKGEGTVLRARRLPGYQNVARIRRLRRHPGHSPAARRLPGLPERSPDQVFTPPSGTLPGGAALAGATRT
ncbi:hypothetical protein TUM17576_17000 [Enterobacter hormaechei]|nr:hypothetical protein TUM17576_17000 [Enterobacter hormaechei]